MPWKEAPIPTRALTCTRRVIRATTPPPRLFVRPRLALALAALLVAALAPGHPAAANAPQADLAVTLTSAPNPLRPGAPLTYTLVVTNAGPESVRAARVVDQVPPEVVGAAWECVVSGGGACARSEGTGNRIDVAVDLAPGASATLTIDGALAQRAAGSLESAADVRAPNDVVDPDERNNTARNITPVAPAADLELSGELLTPADEVLPGALVELAFALRNRGPVAAGDVQVAEQLGVGLEIVGAAASKGAYDVGSGRWDVGALAPDEVARLTLRARWGGAAATAAAQVSRAGQPDPDSAPGDDAEEDDRASIQLPPQLADLALTKTAPDPQARVGANAVITLRVSNAGPATATGVRVADRLPPGLAYAYAVESQGAYDPITGQWAVGSLDPGAGATLTVVATLLDAGPFTGIAQVSAADQPDPDSAPNNDDAAEDDQAGATLAGLLADLSLSQSADGPRPPGRRVTFTLRAANDGPGAATGVEVRDALPAGLTFVRATPSQGAYDAAGGRWAVGELAVGEAATLRIEADAADGPLPVNVAQVSAAGQPDPDSAPGNDAPEEDDQAAAALTAQRADLELRGALSTGAPRPRGEVTVALTLQNRGAGQATGTLVSAQLPRGLAYVGHSAAQGSYNPSTGLWRAGDLAAGATAGLQVRARLDGAGPYTLAAQVSAAGQPDPDSTPNNSAPGEDDQAAVAILAPLADLSVSQAALPPSVPASGEITFRARVRNDGPGPASGVALAQRLPAGATLLASAPSKGSFDPSSGAWAVGELAPGRAATLNLRVRLAENGPYTATAEVVAAGQPDPDSAPGNGAESEDDQASAFPFGASPPAGRADLELRQSAARVERLADGIAYIVEVTNGGPGVATGVEVLDRLPPGARFVGAAPSQGRYDPETGTWALGRLPPQSTATLTLLAISAAPQGLTNSAQVSAADQPDPDSAPNNDAEEDDQAAVTGVTWVSLLAFEAERLSAGVLLTWRTGGELDVAGFHLYRSAGEDRAGAIRVTAEPIAARGGPRSEASYAFLDANSSTFAPYRYWLVAVEIDGELGEQGALSTAAALSEAARLNLPLLP